jgi:hypothetical protein
MNKVILMILDGWENLHPKVSAIDNANIPFIKVFIKLPKCPTSHGPKCRFTGGTNEIAKWTHESWCRTHRLSGFSKINLAVNKTLQRAN